MVRTKKPSGACQNCKTRRIRCDEGRPQCKRCLKVSTLCLGYGRSPRDPETGEPTQKVHQQDCTSLSPRVSLSTHFNTLPPVFARCFMPSSTSIAISATRVEFLSGLENVLYSADGYACKLLRDTMAIFCFNLECMRAGSQTLSIREEAHKKYGMVISGMRSMLQGESNTYNPHLVVSIYLLALFEMVVSMSTEDKTWRQHLLGLKALLSRPVCRLRFGQRSEAAFLSLFQDGLDQFRRIAPQIDDFSIYVHNRRTIEVRKLRVDAKKIRKIFFLVRSLHKKFWKQSQYFQGLWITAEACFLLVNLFLLESGYILHQRSKTRWDTTREFSYLQRNVQGAKEVIYQYGVRYVVPTEDMVVKGSKDKSEICLTSYTPTPTRPEFLNGVMMLYPLYVTLYAADAGSSEYARTLAILQMIAEQCLILKGLGMTCNEDLQNSFSYVEVVDGLELLFLGFRVP